MKKVVLMFVVLGALALTTPVIAQGPPPGRPGMGGPRGGQGGPGGFAARMAQMEKMRTGIYDHLGLNAKQKKALAKLDKHAADEREAMFKSMGGGMGRPGGGPGARPGGPGARPGGPPMNAMGGAGARRMGAGGPPGGGRGGNNPMREKFRAMQKEHDDGMQKIMTKAQWKKYSDEWEKIRPKRGGRGGGGGRGATAK